MKNTAQYLSWYRYPKYLKKSLYNCQNIFTIAACFMKTNTVFEKSLDRELATIKL